MNKKVITIIWITLIIGFSIFIGMIASGYFTRPKAASNGIIVSTKNTQGKLLTSYEEYTKLMDEYNTSNFNILTKDNFTSNDYIVDFIKYKDNLEIYNVRLEVNDTGIKVIYDVNKEIKNSNKYLMYFIPAEKGLIQKTEVTEQVFNEGQV